MSEENEKKDPPQQVTLTIPEEWVTWLRDNALLLAILFLIFILIIIVVWRTRKRGGSHQNKRWLYYYA
jgi:heme/copper-type cytochrome/quinol oxidase subunit 2